MAAIRTARKDHRCLLCEEIIPKGTKYGHQRITPWDHPDNECFFTYRAHTECDELWGKVGREWDWEFPDDPGLWKEMLAHYRASQVPTDGQGPKGVA